jgi:ankyrin repeat protein
MHLKLGGVMPLSSTKTLDLKRESILGMLTRWKLTPNSQLLMLKSVYHKADETTRQKTFELVQQSLAATNTQPDSSLNTTLCSNPGNRERTETPPRPEEVNLEEVSIHFLRTYGSHPNWKQIISSCNEYGQTIAHTSVSLGYLKLLRHLFTWEIDLDAVDSMGLTALHYAYLFKQEECAKFLIDSGVNQFILDDLGRSPSDLDPSLEVRLHSITVTDSNSNADGASPIECDTDEAGKLYAKRFLVQQWMQQGEDESRGGVSLSRCRSLETLGPPRTAGSSSSLDSAAETEWDVTNDRSSSFGVRIPEGGPPLAVVEEIAPEAPAPPHIILPPSPISGVSAQTQEINQPSDIDQNPIPHPTSLGDQLFRALLSVPSFFSTTKHVPLSHPETRKDIQEQSNTEMAGGALTRGARFENASANFSPELQVEGRRMRALLSRSENISIDEGIGTVAPATSYQG